MPPPGRADADAGAAAAAGAVGGPAVEDEAPALSSPADQARAKCAECCRHFPAVAPIDRAEIEADRSQFALIDVRTAAETAVSIIEGAILQRHFEALDPLTAPQVAGKTLVPYCTIGYRSGEYATRLAAKLGPRGVKVRNGQGVLLWTHDGGELVTPGSAGGSVASVRAVHTFGKPWDLAPPGYTTVQFGTLGMAWHGLAHKVRSILPSKW